LSNKLEKNKNTPQKKRKSTSMNQKILIIILFIIIIIIIGFVWFTQTSDVASAQLVIDYGTVQIKHEGGIWTSAETGMFLFQSDAIRTGEDTYASVILFGNSIIRLDNNTEILLKEIIQQAETTNITIEQETGRTWNAIKKISGIDNYEVQTPNTVASVRGTTFNVDLTTSGSTNISVVNGTVNISRFENGTIGDTIVVNGNESVLIESESNETLKTDLLIKDEWILRNLGEDAKFYEQLKTELYNRIEEYIPELKERYGMTDEELDVLIDGYLKGHFDLPPETPEWIRDIIEIV